MDNLEHKIITPYGIPLMPGHLEKTHLCDYGRFIRPDMLLQLQNLEKEELLVTLIAQQIRNAVFNKTFYGGYSIQIVDEHGEWPAQTWNAIGYISLLLSGVFGLKKDIEGIWFLRDLFRQCYQESESSISDMSICVLMCPQKVKGKIVKMTLNGVEVKKIFWNLQGHHKVKLICRKRGLENEGNYSRKRWNDSSGR